MQKSRTPCFKLPANPVLALIILFGAIPLKSWSAPCCAGAGTSSALIGNDDFAHVTLQFSTGNVIGDVQDTGLAVFRNDTSSEVTQTFQVSASRLISDRWQLGTTVPVTRHQINYHGLLGDSTGVGDVSINAAYESLPEWEYSEWKPRGFSFVQLTLPTGVSPYETIDPSLAQVTGKGFTTLGTGLLLTKKRGAFDAYALPEIHYYFPRSFSGNGDPLRVTPGPGGSLSVGIGYTFSQSPWRIGTGLSWLNNGPRKIENSSGQSSQTLYQEVWDATFEINYVVNTQISARLAYIDETLMGPAINTSLQRIAVFSVQQAWER